MTTPLPPEREGSTRQRRAGEGLSLIDKAHDLLPTRRSRQLRNNATPAERKLWSALNNRQLNGVRFNRQVVVGPFICDFVARSVKLVIELDGGQHGDASEYDRARTAFLEGRGYKVIRFWNNEIFENFDGVSEAIADALRTLPSCSREGSTREASGEGLVLTDPNRPSPSRLRRSSPPASGRGG